MGDGGEVEASGGESRRRERKSEEEGGIRTRGG